MAESLQPSVLRRTLLCPSSNWPLQNLSEFDFEYVREYIAYIVYRISPQVRTRISQIIHNPHGFDNDEKKKIMS